MKLAAVVAALGVVTATSLGIAPASADETPKHGGTLTYMIPADAPPSFDGHRETTYATVHSTAPFYSVLIRLDTEHPEDVTKFVCDLCTEVPTPTDNGTTYTFKILEGVKWHDGSPLTADDVVFTYQRARNVPNSPGPFLQFLKHVAKTTAVDDHTVLIETDQPDPILLNEILNVWIVSRKNGENATTAQRSPVAIQDDRSAR